MDFLRNLFGKGTSAKEIGKGQVGQQEIVKRVSRIKAVDVARWILRNGARYGPMTPLDTNVVKVFSDAAQVVDFLTATQQHSMSHCNINWSSAGDVVVAEFHSQASGSLRERFVVLRDKRGPYICYLAWLA